LITKLVAVPPVTLPEPYVKPVPVMTISMLSVESWAVNEVFDVVSIESMLAR
jgi:hypothetical protein